MTVHWQLSAAERVKTFRLTQANVCRYMTSEKHLKTPARRAAYDSQALPENLIGAVFFGIQLPSVPAIPSDRTGLVLAVPV